MMDIPITELKYILLAFTVSMLWAPFLIDFLYKLNITRQNVDFTQDIGENNLKLGTPIMGGLLLVIGISVISIMLNWNGSTKIPLLCMLISALLGGIDDLLNIFGRKRKLRTISKQIKLAKIHKRFIRRAMLWAALPWNIYQNIWFNFGSYPGKGLHAGEKFIIQILAGSSVAWWLYVRLGWSTIWMPFIDPINLGILFPVYVVFVIVAVANAVNISDGMDGLSAGTLLSSFWAFMIIAIERGNPELSVLAATSIGALMAYLYFNIKPARFEMGDVGSLAMGALLASIAFAIDRSILLLVICMPFVVEVSSSLFQSIYKKVFARRLFKMAPLHHHFQIVGWSEEKTVMRFWLFGILFAILGVVLGTY